MITLLSPFGQRCAGIHDPKVANQSRAWLPHSELSVTNPSNTTLNIDCTFYKRVRSVHQQNPLLYNNDSWHETYNKVCNIPFKSNDISDLQRMKMVYSIIKSTKLMHYIYHPTHLLHNIPCMTICKRYFELSNNGNVIKLSQDQYSDKQSLSPYKSSFISAYVLAFGPLHEASIEPTSVWFNIPTDNFVFCSST